MLAHIANSYHIHTGDLIGFLVVCLVVAVIAGVTIRGTRL